MVRFVRFDKIEMRNVDHNQGVDLHTDKATCVVYHQIRGTENTENLGKIQTEKKIFGKFDGISCQKKN